MQFTERRHDVVKQYRVIHHKAGIDTSVGIGMREGVKNRHPQNDDVEEAFVECLGAAEQGHLEIIAELHRPAFFGGSGQTLDLQRIRVGSPYVLNAAQLLDDRSVDLIAAAVQAQAHAVLHNELAEGQIDRRRSDTHHDNAQERLDVKGVGQREQSGQQSGDEVEKSQT